MGCLVEHRGKSEDATMRGLVDEDLLLVVIDGGDTDAAGHHYVGLFRWVAYFEDALPWGELLKVDLCGENGEFIVIQEFEKGDVFELFWVAGHG